MELVQHCTGKIINLPCKDTLRHRGDVNKR